MTPSKADFPEDVPEEVTTALEGSNDRQIRAINHYTQQLLREHPPLTDAIEPRKGEELVRMDDRGEYTIVVVERPDATGEARGPFAYRVKWTPNIDEEGGQYRWHYLGKVSGDTVGH